ncbi:MAG: hypothetical protein KTR32_16245, partial [Granulosicoccus sp.]|nr:hypothetical protein [Granulosicoccus sp.]
MTLQKYRKKPDQFVVAVQLDLDTDGLVYQKWGHQQRCVAGDWLVNNQGDCYTVSKASFAATYSEIMPGIYIKTTPVWARVALESDV